MTSRTAATPTVLVDDERTVTTEWRFPPGAETGWHRHGLDYVVVPLSAGTLRIELRDGTTNDAQLTIGGAYSRLAGVEHNVVNVNDHEFVFVEVEIKQPG